MSRVRSLRFRLTLWYTAALAVLLALFGATALVLLDRGLHDAVDASLVTVARTVAESSRDQRGADVAGALDALLGPALAERFFDLLDPLGRPDPRLAPPSRSHLPLSVEALRNAEQGRETFETLAVPGLAAPLRLLVFPIIERGQIVNLVQVAMSLDTVNAARSRFLLILAALAPLALGGAAAGGWFLAGRTLAPVDAMVVAARRIGAEDLSLRIQHDGADDELGRLAHVLNDMLARLERSFSTARQFSADAAHELRTPLTILKGEIEVAQRSAPAAAEHAPVLESCLEEVDRLIALVEDLLFLARADAGAVALPREPVDLAALVADVALGLEVLAERAGMALNVSASSAVRVLGSAPMLFRVIFNLGDNAVKYAGAGGRVQIETRAAGNRGMIEVRDNGPGIAPEAQAHIFDRFYRGDPARERGGSGLGLALARSIVLAHGGELTVDSTPSAGTCFRVSLPLADR
ncbi:MAG: HAMP domain-containing protein [Deltaproteobacteria bacterium]|nr:HAMP domain-containing protein [Deltaproteobacteria bacterium]MBI3391382.1 HAMP domain-containing protein [Deltaproteobacteria bacterium]